MNLLGSRAQLVMHMDDEEQGVKRQDLNALEALDTGGNQLASH